MKSAISYKIILSVFIINLFHQAHAQEKIAPLLNQVMQNIRSGKVEAIETKPLFMPENQFFVLSGLEKYYEDTLYAIRDKAYSLSASVGSKAVDKTVRQKVVANLVKGCADKDNSVSKNCSKYLERFLAGDFDNQAKQGLAELLQKQRSSIGHHAQIAAFAGMQEMEPRLNSLLAEKMQAKEKWGIRLALARLGNKESIDFLINKATSLSLNDDVIYELAPAFVYTRRKECFNFLISIVHSDEKRCISANPDSDTPILCAYRVLEYLAPALKYFPVKTESSGELKGDYKTALEIARKWLTQKGQDYIIVNTTF